MKTSLSPVCMRASLNHFESRDIMCTRSLNGLASSTAFSNAAVGYLYGSSEIGAGATIGRFTFLECGGGGDDDGGLGLLRFVDMQGVSENPLATTKPLESAHRTLLSRTDAYASARAGRDEEVFIRRAGTGGETEVGGKRPFLFEPVNTFRINSDPIENKEA